MAIAPSLPASPPALPLSGGTNDGGSSPLAPLLSAPATTLTLTAKPAPAPAAPGAYALSVAAAPGGGVALYVELSLRDAAGLKLGFVTFTANLATLRPGEGLNASARILWEPSSSRATTGAAAPAGRQACAEAWNAPLVCVPLPVAFA